MRTPSEEAEIASRTYAMDVDGKRVVVIRETTEMTPLIIAAHEPRYIVVDGGGGLIHQALDSCALIAELGCHVDLLNVTSAGMFYALTRTTRILHVGAAAMVHGYGQTGAPQSALARTLEILGGESFVPEAAAIYGSVMRRVYMSPTPEMNWLDVPHGDLLATGAVVAGRRERLSISTIAATHDPRVRLQRAG